MLKVSKLLCFYHLFRLEDLSIKAALSLTDKNSTDKDNEDVEKTIKLNTREGYRNFNLLQAWVGQHFVFAQTPQQARSLRLSNISCLS